MAIRTSQSARAMNRSIKDRRMGTPHYGYNDIVVVDENSDTQFRPGQKAWVVGVFADRAKLKFDWLPPGTVYTVEFEDGTAIDIPEMCLKRWHE